MNGERIPQRRPRLTIAFPAGADAWNQRIPSSQTSLNLASASTPRAALSGMCSLPAATRGLGN
jgi:hypothetical protein